MELWYYPTKGYLKKYGPQLVGPVDDNNPFWLATLYDLVSSDDKVIWYFTTHTTDIWGDDD